MACTFCGSGFDCLVVDKMPEAHKHVEKGERAELCARCRGRALPPGVCQVCLKNQSVGVIETFSHAKHACRECLKDRWNY